MKHASKRMPVVFIGHGNPMHALHNNAFTRKLAELGTRIPRPKAIVCISAHWTTEGTWVTHMDRPKTIHDFGGFPKALFDVQYPAPGSPATADLVREQVAAPKILSDAQDWGLDHGTWSVLRHLYPLADIPVIQLSLDIKRPPEHHFQLGQSLQPLREKEILLLGSGNLVHNLRLIRWEESAPAYPWAEEFDEWVKEKIQSRDYPSLLEQATQSDAGKMSIPTAEHWDPLLYILGASAPEDRLCFEYEGIENGSISMRTLSFGL